MHSDGVEFVSDIFRLVFNSEALSDISSTEISIK